AALREALEAYEGRSLRGLLGPLADRRVALPRQAWFDCDTGEDPEEARNERARWVDGAGLRGAGDRPGQGGPPPDPRPDEGGRARRHKARRAADRVPAGAGAGGRDRAGGGGGAADGAGPELGPGDDRDADGPLRLERTKAVNPARTRRVPVD